MLTALYGGRLESTVLRHCGRVKLEDLKECETYLSGMSENSSLTLLSLQCV